MVTQHFPPIRNSHILAWLNEGLTAAELLDLQDTFFTSLSGHFVANTAGRVTGVICLNHDGSYKVLAGSVAANSLLFYLEPIHSRRLVQIGLADWDYYVTHGADSFGYPKLKDGTLTALAGRHAYCKQNRQAKMAIAKKAATRYSDEVKSAALELFVKGVKVAVIQAKFGVDRATAYRWRKAVNTGAAEEVRHPTQ